MAERGCLGFPLSHTAVVSKVTGATIVSHLLAKCPKLERLVVGPFHDKTIVVKVPAGSSRHCCET